MEKIEQSAMKIVAVSIEELQSVMTYVVRKELEMLVNNPHLGDDFKDELWDRKQLHF